MKIKIAILLMLSVLSFITVGYSSPGLAIMDFENKTSYSNNIGRGASDILATELIKLNKFDLFERDHINNIIKEQDFGVSGRVDPATAVIIGKLTGVRYIITGAVTEYGKSKSGGGGLGVVVKKTGYHSSVDVRIVDVLTGKIVFSDSGSATKKSVKVKVFGIGGGESFNEKLATESLRLAIIQLADKISNLNLGESGKVTKSASAKSKLILVADVDGNIITLNRGSESGLKIGQTLTVKRKKKEIKDPATGKVIKIKYKTIGEIKITEVADGYSECKIVGKATFEVGDIAN